MDLIEIAKYFKVDGRVESVKSVGEGFINDTYFVKVSSAVPGYILQRKNSNVFKNIPEMMSNIDRVTAHISRKVRRRVAIRCLRCCMWCLQRAESYATRMSRAIIGQCRDSYLMCWR